MCIRDSLKALLHDLKHGGVDVGAELPHHAAKLLRLRLGKQRGLGHGAGRLLPPGLLYTSRCV